MKYKVHKDEFLEWYLDDKDDIQLMGHRIKKLLIDSEDDQVTISAEQLFSECGYIPARIIKDYDGKDTDELETEQCVLFW